jgi:hypothetical protein
MGDAIVPMGTGDSYEVDGSPESDDRLWVKVVD